MMRIRDVDMLKHKLKMGLKNTVARGGYATGLWRFANRVSRKGRITILTLHCVGSPSGTEFLPTYMKLSEELFDRLLSDLARGFDVIPLDEALARLADPSQCDRKNAVVITLDDGYKDNLTHALPILKKYNMPATVFLEAGAVDRQSLTWIHKFFYLRRYKGPAHIADEYMRGTSDEKRAEKLREARAGPKEQLEYQIKRLLKYDIDHEERERIFENAFVEAGGDAQKLLDEAYLTWDEVSTMAEQGISFGCHTMNHPILSTLSKEDARQEIVGARTLIKEKTGIDAHTFAYPWGRNWDFNDETIDVLKEEGFSCGLVMDNSSLFPGKCDFFRLGRYPILSELNIEDVFAQCSGIYDWFGSKFHG